MEEKTDFLGKSKIRKSLQSVFVWIDTEYFFGIDPSSRQIHYFCKNINSRRKPTKIKGSSFIHALVKHLGDLKK